MGDFQDVVLRYRDGRTERAALAPIDATREVLTVQRDGEAGEVPFSQLKAVFFLHSDETRIRTASGSTIAVEFSDGEVIRGTANYNPERNGFFLYPHDTSKSERIFVVNSAIASIEVEKL
jgi:hypothetical protein